MSRAQEHLAQANGHIAELKVQIVRQRVIVKYALDTGQHSEMAESLLDAFEGSLRLFERHRVLILGQLVMTRPCRPWAVVARRDPSMGGPTTGRALGRSATRTVGA